MKEEITFKLVSIDEDGNQYCGKDTSNGSTYTGVITKQGELDLHGYEAVKDSVSFKDDVGDLCTLWLSSIQYELV